MKEIILPRSKSIVIRYMIMSYLYNDQIMEVQENDAEDVKTVQSALLKIRDHKGSKSEFTTIDLKDCGAGFRFLMAVLVLTEGNWLLTGTSRLLERPIMPLIYTLRRIGAEIEEDPNGWKIIGKPGLTAYSIVIDCTQSSQFATAIWLISQKLGSPAFQTTPIHFPSESYLELTKQVWGNFFLDGVPNEIESDWSSALYWYAYALLKPGKEISIKGLQYPSIQQDSIIVDWFEKWGVSSTITQNGIIIKGSPHWDIEPQVIDLQNHLDLAPVLMSLAVLHPFELTIRGISNLEYKESRRGIHLVHELSKFTTIEPNLEETESSEKYIKIFKRSAPLPDVIHFDSYNDHRMVMAFQLFDSFSKITIKNSEVVKKSYPGFWGESR
jgi:3-phosphoshikimate 1-carboxyvinyltransferase